jgi:hypothetical protein
MAVGVPAPLRGWTPTLCNRSDAVRKPLGPGPIGACDRGRKKKSRSSIMCVVAAAGPEQSEGPNPKEVWVSSNPVCSPRELDEQTAQTRLRRQYRPNFRAGQVHEGSCGQLAPTSSRRQDRPKGRPAVEEFGRPTEESREVALATKRAEPRALLSHYFITSSIPEMVTVKTS